MGRGFKVRRDRHVLEALGKTRVVVENGRVVEVGEPLIEYCPLFYKYRRIEKFTQEAVIKNIQFRIEDFGICTPHRKLRMRDFLSFGVSEMLAMCVREGLLDCAVIVSDGAGTVVVSDPELIQGIGGRISGVVETTPIPEIIESIGRDHVLDPMTAEIDQVKGVSLARDLGYDRIGVTVTGTPDAWKIREMAGERAVIFGVHLTGITKDEAENLFEICDIITSCASKAVREVGERKGLLKVGNKIPIYASSERGAMIMRRRLEMTGHRGSGEEDSPRPLI